MNWNHALSQHEMPCGGVAEVTAPRQCPIVQECTLDEHAEFDAVRDIGSATVTLYPPDVVIIKRIIDGGRHLIVRYGGATLCVISRTHIKLSEVKLT
jgi:hypothetical protein